MNTDGVAPHLEDGSSNRKKKLSNMLHNFREYEIRSRKQASKDISSADTPVKSGFGLDLYAFFDSLSTAEKAEALQPLIITSRLKSNKEVNQSFVTPGHIRSHSDVEGPWPTLKKHPSTLTLNQRNKSALQTKWSVVDSEPELDGWDIPHQLPGKVQPGPSNAPIAVHRKEEAQGTVSPSKGVYMDHWGDICNSECCSKELEDCASVVNEWQPIEECTAYPGKAHPQNDIRSTKNDTVSGTVLKEPNKNIGEVSQSVKSPTMTTTEIHKKKKKAKAERKAERTARRQAERMVRRKTEIQALREAEPEPEQSVRQELDVVEPRKMDPVDLTDTGGWGFGGFRADDHPDASGDGWKDAAANGWGDSGTDDGRSTAPEDLRSFGIALPEQSSCWLGDWDTPSVSKGQEVEQGSVKVQCDNCGNIFHPSSWGSEYECCPDCRSSPAFRPAPAQSVNNDPADCSVASESDYGHGSSFQRQVEHVAPLKATYWVQLDSANETVYMPIDSKHVSGSEKFVVEGSMQKVWKWAQDKQLCGKLYLKDIYDLAKVMGGEYSGEDVEQKLMGGSKDELAKDTDNEHGVTETDEQEIKKEVFDHEKAKNVGNEQATNPRKNRPMPALLRRSLAGLIKKDSEEQAKKESVDNAGTKSGVPSALDMVFRGVIPRQVNGNTKKAKREGFYQKPVEDQLSVMAAHMRAYEDSTNALRAVLDILPVRNF
jgi:hypothetical protein